MEVRHWFKRKRKKISRKMEIAMVRATCGRKVEDKTAEEQMGHTGFKETVDERATANAVRWYGYVLKRDDDSVLRVALHLEMSGKRK